MVGNPDQGRADSGEAVFLYIVGARRELPLLPPTERSDVSDDRTMKPLPGSHLRIARPSHDLQASERFWVDGLGLDVLFRAGSSAEGGHALLMVGWPDAAWHLELVSDPGGETPAMPTEEDLLVLYLNGEVDADVVRRLIDVGGQRPHRPRR